MNEISKIIDELVREDARPAYKIAEAANISKQLLSSYRRDHDRTQPWVRLEKVLAVLGYEIEIVKVGGSDEH